MRALHHHHLLLLLTTLLCTTLISAQNCYYPDGSLSTEGDAQCQSSGGACCPLNWQCMSNGLCYLENEGYYGRYTCTDQHWGLNCPPFCTYGKRAIGNEAMLWCANGKWCCDHDRVSGNCCEEDDTLFLDLPKPSPIAFISTVPSPTPVNTKSSSVADPPSSSSTPADVSSSSLSSSSRQIETMPIATVPSTTRTHTDTTITPASHPNTNTSTPTPLSHHHPTSHLPLILGLALGIPLALTLLTISLYFSIHHLRQSNKLHHLRQSNLSPRPKSPPIEANYANVLPGTYASELEGSEKIDVGGGWQGRQRLSELSAETDVSPMLSGGKTKGGFSPVSPQWSESGRASERVRSMGGIPEGVAELGGDVPVTPRFGQGGGSEHGLGVIRVSAGGRSSGFGASSGFGGSPGSGASPAYGGSPGSGASPQSGGSPGYGHGGGGSPGFTTPMRQEYVAYRPPEEQQSGLRVVNRTPTP